ncbi:hypothetical protein BGZ81_000355, partial [Podila clonocystis]
ISYGCNDKGIHVVADAIVVSEPYMRAEPLSYVVLAGGNTKISGFENRLQNELLTLMDPTLRSGIVASANREWSSWLGGTPLSSLSTFGSMCMRLEEYKEYGPNRVHRVPFDTSSHLYHKLPNQY